MARQKFGGSHTEQKLAALEKYLRAYTTALKRQRFKLVYLDAFAGTGEIELTTESAPLLEGIDRTNIVEGSVLRALRCEPRFDEFIFVEKSRSKVRALQKLKETNPEVADRIDIRRGDANDQLNAFCKERDWRKWRAVVFLDPFGNQVAWSTIETLARTNAVDLWYLFPSGLGVFRQIGRDGTVHYTHGDSLDRLMGTPDWRKAFLEEEVVGDLFSRERAISRKVATPESITHFMIARMKSVFKGGVADEWLPLGSKTHKYSLIFAWANPSEKARLAGKLAAAVLRSEKRGRTK